MNLSRLIAALPSIETQPQSDPDITLITADSRQVIPGALFVAYPGVSIDGHDFIHDAITRGAVAVIGELDLNELPIPQSTIRIPNYIRVRSGREAFAYLHAAWNDYPARKLIMIGVTGTDGKTTTTNLIHSILTAAGIKAGMISTVNALIGDRALDTGLHTTTPDADEVQLYLKEMVDAGMTHCVLETTSHGLMQHRVDGCEYDIAVVTNITHEHLDMHGSYEAYRAAKSILFESLASSFDKGLPKSAILNLDDSSYPYLKNAIERSADRGARHANILTYSVKHPANCAAIEIDYRPDAIHFTVIGTGYSIDISTSLVGEYNVSNCLAAIAATIDGLQIDPQIVRRGIANLKGVPGRMERINAGQDFIAIVDFAHTPNALDQAIAAARTMTDGQVIVAFGCAGLRDRDKRRLMGEVVGKSADKIVITAED
ncbi:MAG TPA: UDP-N-acetylmuramoyl-L-alanyl-D-glutamate--2,6-diaminopimelate ligase, partial [Anaerolineae bacterium]|nr:UDP-N-acetylmuramoyl-L-alanyl-D-glutamate--2,6-diaminopimelate ligase [Anaerolineae bacterium]